MAASRARSADDSESSAAAMAASGSVLSCSPMLVQTLVQTVDSATASCLRVSTCVAWLPEWGSGGRLFESSRPDIARPVGITSSDWPFSRLGDSFRPPGQSCGQRFDRSVPPDTLPRPLDSWLLPSSQPYGRTRPTPSLYEHQARTLGHK